VELFQKLSRLNVGFPTFRQTIDLNLQGLGGVRKRLHDTACRDVGDVYVICTPDALCVSHVFQHNS
jgi:hypothetical protein